jgi:hypothetical protein
MFRNSNSAESKWYTQLTVSMGLHKRYRARGPHTTYFVKTEPEVSVVVARLGESA